MGLLAVLAAAACGTHAAQPAWPKMHDTGSDGGESLAPHEHAETAAAIEDDPHPAPVAAEVPIAPVIAPPPSTDGTTATVVSPEDTPPLQIEDTVIEVHDDGNE